jgi:hypothetical protein
VLWIGHNWNACLVCFGSDVTELLHHGLVDRFDWDQQLFLGVRTVSVVALTHDGQVWPVIDGVARLRYPGAEVEAVGLGALGGRALVLEYGLQARGRDQPVHARWRAEHHR